MKFLRLLACLFVFCVDVHVKAEGVSPVDCWGKSIPCAIQTKSARRVLEAKDLQIVMSPGALIEQRDGAVIQLVRGEFYIATSSKVTFQTPYARVQCDSECKGLFTRTLTTWTVKNLAGQWRIDRQGEAQTYVLLPALQVTLGEVGLDGRASMDFPQSLPWLPTVKQWASLYPGDIKGLKPELESFREVWKDAVEAVSHLHQETALRAVAADQHARAAAEAKLKAVEAEDQSLRNLFRQKNFINP